MPLPPLSKRVCQCGCGELFTPSRSDQKYATDTCKTRAYRARKNPKWFSLLTLEEKGLYTWLLQQDAVAYKRAALYIELEGRKGGARSAIAAISLSAFILGLTVDGPSAWLMDNFKDRYDAAVFDSVISGNPFDPENFPKGGQND